MKRPRPNRAIVLALATLAFLMAAPINAWTGLASAATPEEILAGIQKNYANLTSLRADYTRTTTTPAMDGVFQASSKQTASGILYYKKPAKLILDQTVPRVEKMTTDGGTVWWYVPAEKTVHRYSKVDVYGELKPLLDFLGGLSKLEGHFAVKVTPAGEAPNINHRLDLTRLQEGSGPTGISVWCSPQDYGLLGFRLTSLTGETTLFNLSGVQMNPKMDDKSFIFDIPAGVTVVEEDKGKM